MNVLRVIPTMNPAAGGPSQGIRLSVAELIKLGITNEVVSFDDPNSDFIRNAPFKIHAIGIFKQPWAYNFTFPEWLATNLHRFDVVIIHGLWLYHSQATFKAVKKYRKYNNSSCLKLYIMPHGMLDPWFQRNGRRRLKAIRNWFYWHLIEKNVVNNSNGILFTCQEELRLAKETFISYNPHRELNVGYGVPIPPIYHSGMKIAFQSCCSTQVLKPYILYLSRIDPKKGVDLLIKAYLNLKNNGYCLPQLVIAGPGLETSYGQKMQFLASSDNDILFTGMLTGEAKWGAFYGCEAFILPSHQENFGIAVAEALACRKPVLISNQVNIWREIYSFGAGIVSDDTLEGVIYLLRKWSITSDNEKFAMSYYAYNAYENNFHVTAVAVNMNNLFLC